MAINPIEGGTPISSDGVDPRDVTHLSFEGGGGKGLAYLGTLTALTHPNIDVLTRRGDDYVLNTEKIEGVSGASAGAITAVLLASGMSLREIYNTMFASDVSFYDTPERRIGYVPLVRKGAVKPIDIEAEGYEPVDGMVRGAGYYDRSEREGMVMRVVVGPAARLVRPASSRLAKKLTDDPVVQHAVDHPRGCGSNLLYDHGLLSGCFARTYLAEKFDSPGEDGEEIAFGEFENKHGVDLRIVGSNLSTEESVVFSQENTPEFKVADAVRISMSFPGVFKPVPIGDPFEYDLDFVEDHHVEEVPGEAQFQQQYRGLWADGGATNNNPIHVFDDEDGTLPAGMVGFRLGEDQRGFRNEVDGLWSYIHAVANTLLSVRSDGEIRSPSEARQVVNLPLGDLSLTNFSPDADTLKDALIGSTNETFRYFGVQGNPALFLYNRLGME